MFLRYAYPVQTSVLCRPTGHGDACSLQRILLANKLTADLKISYLLGPLQILRDLHRPYRHLEILLDPYIVYSERLEPIPNVSQ